MDSPSAASRVGECNGEHKPASVNGEPKSVSVEEVREVIAEATTTDEQGNRRMKAKEYWDHVVVPLPQIAGKKANEYSKSGKEIEMTVNGYPIQKYPKKPVYMYEVSGSLAISGPCQVLSQLRCLQLQVLAIIEAREDKRLLPTLDQRLMRLCFEKSRELGKLLPDAIHDGAHIVW
jgi:hypothetical protein